MGCGALIAGCKALTAECGALIAGCGALIAGCEIRLAGCGGESLGTKQTENKEDIFIKCFIYHHILWSIHYLTDKLTG